MVVVCALRVASRVWQRSASAVCCGPGRARSNVPPGALFACNEPRVVQRYRAGAALARGLGGSRPAPAYRPTLVSGARPRATVIRA
jgi:hypothetical protein